MGKILATLRQNGPVVLKPSTRREVPLSPAPLAETEPVGEAVPYIEIGPRRQVEASPDVLGHGAKVPASPPANAVPRPHSVRFRNLPSRNGTQLAPELVAYHAAGQAGAVQYGELLTSLVEAAQKRAGANQALLFTAPRSEAGCSTVLLNVAITAAGQGRKVVVVDANLRRPGVARKLGLPDAPGLAEVLADDCELETALRETAVENLTALTAGTATPFLADLSELRSLVEELRDGFDLVLVDGSRWDGRAGCQALAGMCDATFLVVPSAEADSPPASELMQNLPGEGVALAGCVLTNP